VIDIMLVACMMAVSLFLGFDIKLSMDTIGGFLFSRLLQQLAYLRWL